MIGEAEEEPAVHEAALVGGHLGARQQPDPGEARRELDRLPAQAAIDRAMGARNGSAVRHAAPVYRAVARAARPHNGGGRGTDCASVRRPNRTVYSKSEGYLRNNGAPTYGQETFCETPTLALVNSFGRTNNDRPHELKVFATWIVPKVEVNLSGYYSFLSGRPYTPFQRFGSGDINWPTRAGRGPFLEARGNRRLENESNLDLRIEKIFNVTDFGRLSVFADIQNVFNESTMTAVNTRHPFISVAGFEDPITFEGPTTVVQPRRFRLGARWSF